MNRHWLPVIGLALLTACAPASEGLPAPGSTTGEPVPSTNAPTTTRPGPPSTTPHNTAPPTTTPVTAVGEEGAACWAGSAHPESPAVIEWQEVTGGWGLVDPLTGMHGHAVAVGDIDGDLGPDLVVGTFADRPEDDYRVRGAEGPAPDRLLRWTSQGYVPDPNFAETRGRTSGAVLADLDLDGDLDLVLARNPREGPRRELGSSVYRNQGGELIPVEDHGIPAGLGARSVGVLDLDGDLLPELVVLEDRWQGGETLVLRNRGALRFEPANARYGFPDDVHGLGVATGDLNGDRLTDLVVGGSNRLFLGTGSGLAEVELEVLEWETYGNEDDVAGAALADLNRDGRLDLVLGHHYNSTVDFGERVPVRVYLNRTETGSTAVRLEDVTEAAGIPGFPTKAPHVELADLDNDGWPDLLTSASAGDGDRPLVLRHQGLEGGVPRFEPVTEPGPAQYWVAAPVADVDRDGRLDVFLLEWEPSLPSRLMLNQTRAGHWLSVSVDASLGGGPGTRVEVYEAGQAGDPSALLGVREITPSVGYSAGIEAHAHFGLGERTSADLVVIPPPPHQPITLPAVAADRHLHLPTGC